MTEDEIKKNKNVVVIPCMGNDEYKYALEISYENCTGCGLCANTCPGKLGAKALIMTDHKEVERINNEIKNITNKKLYLESTIKGVAFNEPLFKYSGACAGCGETPYLKLLTQIYKDGLIIANATGCSSIYGGSLPTNPYNVSWSNSLFEDNAEYGLGMRITMDLAKEKITNIMKERLKGRLGIKNIEMFNKWLVNKDNYNITKEIMENINYDEVKELEPLKGYIMSKDVWIVGGDGWSYDIGFGGIDHIMASGEDVNILVLDTEVYSNTGGQASKSTEKGAVAKFANDGKKTSKKDLARMMMGYPNVYVAQISLGANMNQAIKALRDAGSHKGPSLVIAYSPCINHGIKKGMGNSIEEERLAVKSGYFPIFRYDGEKEEFTLDFKSPDFDLYDKFLDGENRYTMIKTVSTKLAKELFNVCETISTSFATLDKTSPILFLSKYFSGSLLIFIDIFSLRLLANLLATTVILIDSIYVNKALKIYNTARKILISLILFKFILGLTRFLILSGIKSSLEYKSLISSCFIYLAIFKYSN